MQNKKLATVLILTATILLAGVALFTAIKLYQIGQEDLSLKKEEKEKVLIPDSQEEIPFIAQHEGAGVCELTFSISESPSEEPSSSPSDEPTPPPSDEPNPSPSDEPSPSSSPPVGGVVPPASPTIYQQGTVPTQELPEAGVISPTLIFSIGGIALLALGLLL